MFSGEISYALNFLQQCVRNKVVEYAFIIAIMINLECIIRTGHNQVLLMYAYR